MTKAAAAGLLSQGTDSVQIAAHSGILHSEPPAPTSTSHPENDVTVSYGSSSSQNGGRTRTRQTSEADELPNTTRHSQMGANDGGTGTRMSTAAIKSSSGAAGHDDIQAQSQYTTPDGPEPKLLAHRVLDTLTLQELSTGTLDAGQVVPHQPQPAQVSGNDARGVSGHDGMTTTRTLSSTGALQSTADWTTLSSLPGTAGPESGQILRMPVRQASSESTQPQTETVRHGVYSTQTIVLSMLLISCLYKHTLAWHGVLRPVSFCCTAKCTMLQQRGLVVPHFLSCLIDTGRALDKNYVFRSHTRCQYHERYTTWYYLHQARLRIWTQRYHRRHSTDSTCTTSRFSSAITVFSAGSTSRTFYRIWQLHHDRCWSRLHTWECSTPDPSVFRSGRLAATFCSSATRK